MKEKIIVGVMRVMRERKKQREIKEKVTMKMGKRKKIVNRDERESNCGGNKRDDRENKLDDR